MCGGDALVDMQTSISSYVYLSLSKKCAVPNVNDYMKSQEYKCTSKVFVIVIVGVYGALDA